MKRTKVILALLLVGALAGSIVAVAAARNAGTQYDENGKIIGDPTPYTVYSGESDEERAARREEMEREKYQVAQKANEQDDTGSSLTEDEWALLDQKMQQGIEEAEKDLAMHNEALAIVARFYPEAYPQKLDSLWEFSTSTVGGFGQTIASAYLRTLQEQEEKLTGEEIVTLMMAVGELYYYMDEPTQVRYETLKAEFEEKYYDTLKPIVEARYG